MTDAEGLYVLDSGGARVTRATYSTLGYQSRPSPFSAAFPKSSTWPSRPEVWTSSGRGPSGQKSGEPRQALMQRVAEAKKGNDPARIPALRHDFYEVQEVAFNDYLKLPARRFGVHLHGCGTTSTLPKPRGRPLRYGSRRDPAHRRSQREKRIEAARATWMQNGENTSSVQSEFLNINLYENQMLLLDRAFTSPLHDRGNVHYRYYILDTLDHGSRPCFHLAFVPRRRGELTFEGEMWIDTLTLGAMWRPKSARVPKSILSATTARSDLRAARRSMGARSGRKLGGRQSREGHGHLQPPTISTRTLTRLPRGQIRCGRVRGHEFAKGSNDVLEETWATLRPTPLPPSRQHVLDGGHHPKHAPVQVPRGLCHARGNRVCDSRSH